MGALIAILAMVVVVLFAVMLLARLAGPPLNRLMDRWRPCARNQARPPHDMFILVFFLLAAALWFASYNPLVALREVFARGDVALLLGPVMVVAAPLGAFGLVLHWMNASIEYTGQKVRITNWRGDRTDWLTVARMFTRAGFREPARAYFDIDGRLVSFYVQWTNMRTVYDALAASGTPAEPWLASPEKARSNGR